ncbi:MAG: DUF3536 domain-containing protein [Methanoregula sp.]|nr:DUF3536 domain-containing protein [Methanoregula sp.]
MEVEDSAYPWHDWNARITAECYAPNTASRILDAKKNIIDIVNNYASISFNFGPTLLMWLEQNNPRVYSAILDADKESMRRFSGHGSAIAQVYNHMIMPLANIRDKRTQVIWGIQDFIHRFGRAPEGMWLAETAVDLETLEVLAGQGILFTILSPSQASRVKILSGSDWTPVTADTLDCSMPYVCQLASGRSIAIFFFDNIISQELAFGTLLENGEKFALRMMQVFSRSGGESGLLSVVSDGETFGHHHRFADMALAYALYDIQEKRPATITIFGEYLASHPPMHVVEIKENTSWSCPHGIERWRSNCGCCTRGATVHDTDVHQRITLAAKGSAILPVTCVSQWNQEWRAPFRDAMDWLRDEISSVFETAMNRYVSDPWAARDDYIAVILDRTPESRERFFARHTSRPLTDDEKQDVLMLLEMQRHALLMFTSCGWFFDDISGIESLQVMEYACRAMQLVREVSGTNPEPLYLSALSRVKSNKPDLHDGATIYLNFVQKSMVDLHQIVFNHTLSLLITDTPKREIIRHYEIVDESFQKTESGDHRMITGTLTIRSEITTEQKRFVYAVLHLGDYEFIGGVREYRGDAPFQQAQDRLYAALGDTDTALLIHIMEEEFGTSIYSLWHLFKDAQRDTLFQLLASTLTDLESSFRQIYRQHIKLIHAMREMQIPVPRVLEDPVWHTLNVDLNTALMAENPDKQKAHKLVNEMIMGQFAPDGSTLGFTASRLFASLTKKMVATPEDPGVMQEIVDIFTILAPLSLNYELWECQNDYFYTGKKLTSFMLQKAKKGDAQAVLWIAVFRQLGSCLGVRCI